MRNVYIYLCLLMLIGIRGFGQNENNHWQIGSLDFNFATNPNTITIVPGVPDLSAYYFNSYATLSDQAGAMLFYYTGEKLVNKNHQVITSINYDNPSNGADEFAVIVPHPGNPNQYYLFYNDYFHVLSTSNPGVFTTYFHALLDFGNNPLGEVVQVTSPVINERETNNRQVFRDASGQYIRVNGQYRPITVTKNSAGTGYWLIIQKYNQLFSYLIDANGLNTVPVVSTFPVGAIYNYNNGTSYIYGSMFRVVPNYNNTGNNKLLALEEGSDNFYSLDFNAMTGSFSNYSKFNTGLTKIANFEVSANNRTVYFVRHNSTSGHVLPSSSDGELYVYDIGTPLTAPRRLYEYDTPSAASVGFNFLQKDKYGNILIGSRNTNGNRDQYVHKIMNPDSFLSSSVKVNFQSLNGKKIYFFPQLIERVSGCTPSITLSAPETNTTFVYKASESITANQNYSINSGVDITFKAGQFIALKPDTHIKSGAVFLGKIENCSGVIYARPSNTINKIDDEPSTTNSKLTIFPNPTNSVATITHDNPIKEVSVMSLDGKIMLNKKLSGHENKYDLSLAQFQVGIYIITVVTDKDEIITSKLIKN